MAVWALRSAAPRPRRLCGGCIVHRRDAEHAERRPKWWSLS